jgi:uncharacterized protein (DUF39 family)
MPDIVAELGEEGALKEVDVVTTGTFGAMCSSGAFLNFGHAEPPIRMERVWLNDVEAYGGLAAVDAYIGATQQSTTREDQYGGAHVIEDLVSGKAVELRAISRGTDCYPRRTITTELLLENLNQAIMCNPRNAYQRYNARSIQRTGPFIRTWALCSPHVVISRIPVRVCSTQSQTTRNSGSSAAEYPSSCAGHPAW